MPRCAFQMFSIRVCVFMAAIIAGPLKIASANLCMRTRRRERDNYSAHTGMKINAKQRSPVRPTKSH
jgi:hypothetical protein